MLLSIQDEWFTDAEHRAVLLRGITLGGSSKVPYPDGATHLPTDFSNHRDVSFVGRPFPLEDADEHFSRIKAWGFNCLRFIVTWEAVEHEGPSLYDNAYLDYVEEMVRRAGDYGFYVFIDMHQDVWSRMSGGDGAPGWLFEKVGLDFTKFQETGAAVVMQQSRDYEPMCWVENYSLFAAATMFTLFFGGNEFAFHCFIDGAPVKEYMQNHFIDALSRVVERVQDMPHLLGYDCFNEPHPGFIGAADATTCGFMPGLQMSPFDAMVTAAGFTRRIGVAEVKRLGLKVTKTVAVNPSGVSCWLPGRADIWQREGVWKVEYGEPVLLQKGYFSGKGPFFNFYVKPFLVRCARKIREVHPESLLFVEGDPFGLEGKEWGPDDGANVVNASHWYDVVTLLTKKFQTFYNYDVVKRRPVFTRRGIQSMFRQQLGLIKKASVPMGRIPTVIGEFGIPFDMNDKEAYRTGDFSSQVEALSMNYDAMDFHLLPCVLWNYTADNTNAWGDQWNLEDLSVFSTDQRNGRAVEGFCRPYARKTAGTPVRMSFDRKKGVFTYTFEVNTEIRAPTEIFVPSIQYPGGYNVRVEKGYFREVDGCVHVFCEGGRCTVEIRRKKGCSETRL